MTKPFKEERTDLKTGLKFSFFLLLFLPINIFPQIPINGFIKYNRFETASGFTNLFAVNFNKDSYTDLLLFNPSLNKITAASGGSNIGMEKQKQFDLAFPLSSLKIVLDRNKEIKGYGFVSRKTLKAGLLTFSIDGRPEIINEIKFNTYPENITTGSIDASGNEVMLVSGSAFKGLSIITLGQAKEKVINNESSYSEALLVDLNNDGVNDIAAFDVLNNSLNFFYNNTEGEFRPARKIGMNNKIFSFQSFDLNLDSYKDLLFVKDKKISIMYGDFSSSYANRIELNVKFYPDKIITGDFNRDGKIDIAYLNYKESTISLIFAKADSEFHPEILYLKKNKIKDIIPYYSKFINGIAALSEEGNIYTITKTGVIGSAIDLTIGAEPEAISYFDIDNSGINNFCFIDKYDNSIKVVVRDNEGMPSRFYSFSLFENHSEILVDNTEPKNKTFYCYSFGKKLIETLNINFEKNEIVRNSIYLPGEVRELRVKKNKDDLKKLYAVFVKNNKLGLSVFNYSDQKYSSYNYFDIAGKIKSVNISLAESFSLNYWIAGNDSVKLKRTTITKVSKTERTNLSAENSIKNPEIISFTGDLLNNDKDVVIGFIHSDSLNSAVFVSDDFNYEIYNQNLLKKLNVKKREQLFFGQTRINGIKKLMIHNPEKKVVHKLDFINNGREVTASKIIDNVEIKRYFVRNMNFKKYHIVFTNRKENCISIRTI